MKPAAPPPPPAKPVRPGWTVKVVQAARDGATRAAEADGIDIGAYLEGLVNADLARRGWPLEPVPPELSVSDTGRIRNWVHAAAEPVGAVEIAEQLGIARTSVDAVLSRGVTAGEFERVGTGRYRWLR